jgi:hypothetical protein
MPNELYGVIGGVVILYFTYFFNKRFDKDKREHEKGSRELVDFDVIAKIYKDGMDEYRIELTESKSEIKSLEDKYDVLDAKYTLLRLDFEKCKEDMNAKINGANS